MARRRGAFFCTLFFVPATTGCALLNIADKVYQSTNSDEDETIRLSVPEVVAEGATFEVDVIDACTRRADRCEVDRIEVSRASATGPFVVESFDGDVVTLRADGVGKGTVDVTASMDGESPSATADLRAAEVLEVTVEADCVGEPSRWIAAGGVVGLDFGLFGFREQLAGSLEPPIDTTLELVELDAPGHAVYDAPATAGVVPVTSQLDGTSLLTLEVFDPAVAIVELVAPTRLSGSTLVFDLEERVDGERPCVESGTTWAVRSDAPDVCLPNEGVQAAVEVTVEVGRVLRVSVSQPGSCVLLAGPPGGDWLVTSTFAVDGA